MTTTVLLMGPPPMTEEQQPPTVTVRLATELVEMARIVCAHTKGRGGKQTKLVDYLDSLLRPLVTRDHAAVLERVANEQKGKGKKSSQPKEES